VASRALVIGVGSYAPNSGIDSYPTIGASALRYGDVLSRDSLWGPGSCQVLTEDEARTVDGVMTALERTANETGPDDTLLVVYVGHGMYWTDLPTQDQVHFAVGTSFQHRPWTWLSSWYVYRVIRKAKARLKVFIADCCFSDLLQSLGGATEDSVGRLGVLGERGQGTCVFTALKGGTGHYTSAEGCPNLAPEFADCTPFSGHLLQLLRAGTRDHPDHFTIGHLREAVKDSMESCGTHSVPKMLLNDASESTPIFTNHMDSRRRHPVPTPGKPAEWARVLKLDRMTRLTELLTDERNAGAVVAFLRDQPDPESRDLARHIEAEASRSYDEPERFARYWSSVVRPRSMPA
jgi:Caspase domain